MDFEAMAADPRKRELVRRRYLGSDKKRSRFVKAIMKIGSAIEMLAACGAVIVGGVALFVAVAALGWIISALAGAFVGWIVAWAIAWATGLAFASIKTIAMLIGAGAFCLARVFRPWRAKHSAGAGA